MTTICNDPDLSLPLGKPRRVKTLTLLKGLRQAAEFYGFRALRITTSGKEETDSQRGQALSRTMAGVTINIVDENGYMLSRWKEGARL